MTKLEIVSGCYNTELLIDGKDASKVSKKEMKSIVSQLLLDLDKALLINVLEFLVNQMGQITSDEEPCEQCGAWTGVITLNLD